MTDLPSYNTLSAGNFVLLNNKNTTLDRYLINKDYLFKRINEIKIKKTNDVNASIKKCEDQITNLRNAINSNTLSNDIAQKYNELINNLTSQINKLERVNVNPSFMDLNQSHFIFLNTVYKPIVSVGYAYSKMHCTPLPLFGGTYKIKIPIYGEMFSDMVLNIKLSSFHANNLGNKVKYCDLPGHKLIKAIRFVIDSTVIDEYGTEDMNFHYQFRVQDSQKFGWRRCVGQEMPKRGFFCQDPTNQDVREEKVIFNGHQTLKYKQDSMELLIPLNFWYCDPRFAMSNNNITYDKTYIEFDLCELSELIQFVDYQNTKDGYTLPEITGCSLYTNHIYLIPEVAELFKFKNTFNIVRLHRNMTRIVDKPYGDIHLNDIKFAVEQLYVHFRPIANESNVNIAEVWHKNNIINYVEIPYASIIKVGGVKSLAYTNAYYYDERPSVDVLAIRCGGNNIFEPSSATFYDSYLPYRFGENKILTPSGSGSFLFTFNLYPNDLQPSGYINLSSSRENYLTYSSTYITTATPCRLHVSAQIINFMYLSEGSITIRFSS